LSRAAAATERLRRSASPVAAEVLEGRLLLSTALKNGGSGYSGTLSSNPTVRQQQLICDPIEPRAGSTSVMFDPKLVRLIGFQEGPGEVSSAKCSVSRPQTSQAAGSNASAHGASSVSAASATAPIARREARWADSALEGASRIT